MDNFIYNISTKIYFGKDEETKIGKLIKGFCPKKVLIHYGSNHAKQSGLLNRIENLLKQENISYVELGGVIANPLLSLVRKGINICEQEKVDFILAIGGGSVMDSSKAIAIGAANPNVDVWDIITNKVKPTKSLNKASILTIAASGSEMSNSCVITNELTHEKRGFATELNRFNFSIENPELTYSVSPYQTACGIVDIAMHTIERFFNPGVRTDVTDELALAIIKTTYKCGIECLNNPCSYHGRANMMWASSLAHNGLTGLGRKFQLVVHQLEHEISGLYPDVVHGAGLAALWCSWARYVYKYNIERWKKYSKAIWNTDDILKAINLQEEYYNKINMPTSIKQCHVKESDLEYMALKVSRNKTRNLSGDKELNYDDVLAIYKMAYK